MSIWEKYQAQLNQQSQRKNDEEIRREREANNRLRERGAKDAAERAEKQARIEENRRRSMEVFNRCNAHGMLNEIASHISGAKVEIRDDGDSGYLRLSVSWERDKAVHEFRGGKKTGEKVEKMKFGIRLECSGAFPECLPVGSGWRGKIGIGDYGFATDQKSLEEALVKGLEHEQQLTDRPFIERINCWAEQGTVSPSGYFGSFQGPSIGNR